MPGPTLSTIDPTMPGPGESARESRRVIHAHGTQVGRYVILSVLGRGGMGVVYAAHDPQLDRQVALKLMRAEEGVEEAERLVREAKALAKLDDPHVVAVYDAGEVDNQVFVAMQLVDGQDLAAAMKQRHPAVPEVLDWFTQAGRGLAAAHAARIVHRDFKPSNVLVDKKGRCAVTDFGIARELGQTHDPERRVRSDVNKLMGTPAYMAPEQHGLERATEASDQFSFCVSLWEALFGEHPFVGDRAGVSSVELGIAIFEGKLIYPKRRGRVPRSLVDALARGLSREPGARWPAMTDLLAQLAPAEPTRRWPIVAGAGVIAAGVAAFLLWPSSRARTCEASAARIDAVWSPQHGPFTLTGTPYAAQVGRMLASQLDAYASRWRAQTLETCLADTGPAPAACLDERLDELRGFMSVIAPEPARVIDATPALVGSLSPVEPCKHATDVPPAGASELRFALGEALARTANATERPRAKRDLADVATRAAKLPWTPVVAHATYLLGRTAFDLGEDGKTSLTSAAEMATAEGLDADAASAWTAVLEVASPDELDTVAAMARAAVNRARDPALATAEAIAHGRALLRAHRLDEAEQRCELARNRAVDAHDAVGEIEGRVCAHEATAGLGRWVQPKNALVDDANGVYGSEHPATAAALAVYARELAAIDHYDDVHILRLLDAVLAMRLRAYPENHPLVARAYRDLGDQADRDRRLDDAIAAYGKALDAIHARRDERALAAELDADLARVSRDPKAALGYAREANTLAPSPATTVALAETAAAAGAWSEAARVADTALATPDALQPAELARLDWVLARALVQQHGDVARARSLAVAARDGLAKLPDTTSRVAEIDAWLARK